MLNQQLKFDLLAENGLLKRINGSNRENEVHKIPEMKFNSLDFFTIYDNPTAENWLHNRFWPS